MPWMTTQLMNAGTQTPATHFSAFTGGTSSTAAIITDSEGKCDRWVNSGSYDQYVNGKLEGRVEAISALDIGGGGGGGALPSGGSVGQVVTNTSPGVGTWQDPDVTQAELNAHTGQGSGAHAATAISYAGSAAISATNVEGALDELDTEKVDDVYVGNAISSHNVTTTAHEIANTQLLPPVAVHNGTSYPFRPAFPLVVIWIGPTAPTIGGAGNAVNGDIWIATA